MDATKENILNYLSEIKNEFSKRGIASFALFGSYAKDTQTPYSDIDIAISKQADFLKYHSSYSYFDTLSIIKEQITKKFNRNTDIFDLDSQSPLKKHIEKELLYV